MLPRGCTVTKRKGEQGSKPNLNSILYQYKVVVLLKL
jgi:hypothetical protein